MVGLRTFGAAVAVVLVIIAGAPTASADTQILLPEGQGCAFELLINISGGKAQYREFYDMNGNLVRTISAGRGFDLTFTNTDTGKSLAFPSNGSVRCRCPSRPGSHVLLSPTDTEPG